MRLKKSVEIRESNFFFVSFDPKILSSTHPHDLITAITKQLKNLASRIITESDRKIPHSLCLSQSLIAFKAFETAGLVDYLWLTLRARKVVNRFWDWVTSCEDLSYIPWDKEIRSFFTLQKAIVAFDKRLHLAYAHDASVADAYVLRTREVSWLLQMLRHFFTSKPCLEL